MGNNDFEFHLGQDTTTESLPVGATATDWILRGTVYDVYSEAHGVRWNDNDGRYEQISSRNTATSFTIWGVMRGNSNIGGASISSSVWISIKVGGVVYRFGMHVRGSGGDFGYSKTADLGDEMTTTASGFTQSSWYKVALVFNSNGTIDMKYHTTPWASFSSIPTFATLRDSTVLNGAIATGIMGGWSSGKISSTTFGTNEIISGAGSRNGSIQAIFVGADEITSGGSADLDITAIQQLVTQKSTGGGGGATITFAWDTAAELAALVANDRKSITVYDTTYGTLMFKGELKMVRRSKKTVEFRAEEGIRKLTNMFATINPVVYHSEIKRVEDHIVYDQFAGWTPTAFVGKMFVTKDADIYKMTSHVTTIDDYKSTFIIDEDENIPTADLIDITPDVIFGNETHLYWDDNTQTTHVHGVQFDPINSNIMTLMTHKIWHKSNTVWDKVTYRIKARWTPLANLKVHGSSEDKRPAIYLYNITTDSWVRIHNFDGDTYSKTDVGSDESWNSSTMEASDNDKSPVMNLKQNADNTNNIVDGEIDILSALGISYNAFKTNYLSAESGENSSGFRSTTLKVIVKGVRRVLLAGFCGQETWLIKTTFDVSNTKSTGQGQALSVGKILTNTGTTITMDETPGWALADFPQADGVSQGDDYWVTDNVEEVIDAMFAAQSKWSVTRDFTTSLAEYGDVEDRKFTPIYDVLQEYSADHNLAFWDISAETTNAVEIRDNFISTGVTLTSSDIVGYNDENFYFDFDNRNLREELVASGDEGIQVTEAIVPEVAETLGEEQVIYRNSELSSDRNVQAFANSKKLLHTNRTIQGEVTLDYTTPFQTYASIAVGKTILVEIDEYSSAVDGALFIESMTYRRIEQEGRRQMVTLSLMKRNT